MHVPVGELIQREGALPAIDVIRWMAETCDALAGLAAAGTWSDVDADNVLLSRSATEVAVVKPRPMAVAKPPLRWQVRQVGALGYQLLKGAPPAFPLNEQAVADIPEPLAQLLVEALSGTGPADAKDLAAALRRLRLPSKPPRRPHSDTVLKARSPGTHKDRSGELFGQFELVQLLGEGGMGDVYLARHVRLAREVAIKLLKPEFAAVPDLVQRFFQEANVVNEIRHPHIVQVQDFVEEPGRVYCVMELLEGMNLADLAETEGPLGLGRICAITVQVCDALHAAHLRDVVHRDIKPENVFVSRGPDGGDFARVLDFGIARRSAAGTGTQAGAVMGTPLYMAPEQAAGRPVDARADLYSVGVMLFELVTRRSISQASTTELPEADGQGGPVPEDVRRLVASLLSLDPSGRPGSADEVRVRLLPHVKGGSASMLMPGVPARPSAPRQPTAAVLEEAGLQRGHFRAALGLGAGLALLAGVAVVAVRLSQPPPPEPAPAVAVAEPPRPAPVAPPPPPPAVAPDPAPPAEPVVEKPPEPLPAVDERDKGKKKRPGREPKQVEVAAAVAAPPPAVEPELKRRVDSIRTRFRALRDKHGADKLTPLEREACQEVLNEFTRAPESVSLDAVVAGEQALEAAEKRLGR